MKARGVVRISLDDVGSRVTVRSLIPQQPGAPSMTDTVGLLESWEGGVLRIRRRDGTVIEIAEGALVAARTILRQFPHTPHGKE